MKTYPLSCALIAGAVLSLGAAAFADPTATITNLGTLSAPFNEVSMGGRINNFGQVTFQSFGKGDFEFGHACLWTPTKANGTTGMLTDLDPTANQRTMQSGGAGINASGQVVGFTTPPPAFSRYVTGFCWSPVTPDKRTSGNLTLITATEGNPGEIHVWALNNPTADHGLQAVGNGPLGMGRYILRRPLLWTNGNVNDLGALPGDNSGDANDINDAGEVVGYTFMETGSLTGRRHAFLWRDGKMIGLGAMPGDNESVAAAINATGQVTGNSFGSVGSSRSFLWIPDDPNGLHGALSDIGLLKEYTDTTSFALNSRGQVVGRAYNRLTDRFPTGHAFLYDSVHGMRDLNSLLPPNSGWELQTATGINDAGQIVGTGLYTEKGKKTTVRRAFLLTLPQTPAEGGAAATPLDK